MRYKNKLNGLVIEVSCKINSEYWEPVEMPTPKTAINEKEPKEVKKKVVRKTTK